MPQGLPPSVWLRHHSHRLVVCSSSSFDNCTFSASPSTLTSSAKQNLLFCHFALSSHRCVTAASSPSSHLVEAIVPIALFYARLACPGMYFLL
ncbi:hypothetical protein AHAS_Ahas01G0236100 [Arachis hypogaea]